MTDYVGTAVFSTAVECVDVQATREKLQRQAAAAGIEHGGEAVEPGELVQVVGSEKGEW